jgi:hypothetical protein
MNLRETRERSWYNEVEISASESVNTTIQDLTMRFPEVGIYADLLAKAPEWVKLQVLNHLTSAQARIAANEDRFHKSISAILK